MWIEIPTYHDIVNAWKAKVNKWLSHLHVRITSGKGTQRNSFQQAKKIRVTHGSS